MENSTGKVSGVALAGGMSRRLGRNKAVEKIGGESLIERVVGRLSQVSSETIVVVAEESRAQALDLPPWVRTAADIYPDSGSLGGIFTGLSAAKGDYGIVVACDMPFLNTDLLRFMLDIASDYDVVVPRLNGRPEPLHTIYSKSCLEPIERRLKRKDLKIAPVFQRGQGRLRRRRRHRSHGPAPPELLQRQHPGRPGQGLGPRGAGSAGRRLDSSGPGTRE